MSAEGTRVDPTKIVAVELETTLKCNRGGKCLGPSRLL